MAAEAPAVTSSATSAIAAKATIRSLRPTKGDGTAREYQRPGFSGGPYVLVVGDAADVEADPDHVEADAQRRSEIGVKASVHPTSDLAPTRTRRSRDWCLVPGGRGLVPLVLEKTKDPQMRAVRE